MPQVLQVKDHEGQNQKLLIGYAIPFQRHSFLPKFSLHSSKYLSICGVLLLFPLAEKKCNIFLYNESTNLRVKTCSPPTCMLF